MAESSRTEPASSYADEAAGQDQFLDQKLAEIRAATDAGTMTTRQAADARVAALEHHIEAIRYLRREHFGNSR